MIWLWVPLGGALGALLRFSLVQLVLHAWGPQFPYGTLLVNVLGAFAIGLVYPKLVVQAPEVNNALVLFLVMGVLGAFTTFSAFSLETFHMLEQSDYAAAVLNILLNVLICLLAVWLGILIGRLLWL